MKKKIKRMKRCPSCKKLKPADEVYERNCVYQKEINDIDYPEIICNDCEEEHQGDI